MSTRFLILIFTCLFLASAGAGAEPQKTEHEGPKMRPVDRDWEYFKKVPCERVDKEVFHSRSEEMLLAKRKSQCLKRYDAFFNKPIDR